MANINHHPSQKGQAIILIAFSVIVLLAMIALAIDGARWFAADRHAQNIADNSAMAAAMALCSGGNPQDTAFSVALANSYNNDGIDNWVTYNSPPVDGNFVGQNGYLRVHIQKVVTPLFAQIFYFNEMMANGAATGRCDVSGTTIFDPEKFRAVWANGASGCHQSISFIDLAGQGYLIEGGIHSNSDIDITGNNITVIGPSTSTGDADAPNVSFDPPMIDNTGIIKPEGFAEYFTWDRFDVGGDIYTAAQTAGRLVFTDQEITETWLQNSCSMAGQPCFLGGVLQDGLYITTNIADPAFKIQGNGVHGDGGAADPANVTIVVSVGGIAFTGNNNLLNPYLGNPNAAGTTAFLIDLPGATLISFGSGSDVCKDDIITFSGTDSLFGGHIYAPNGKIQFAGSNTTIQGCMTGNTIDMSQSNNHLICDPTWFPVDPNAAVTLEE